MRRAENSRWLRPRYLIAVYPINQMNYFYHLIVSCVSAVGKQKSFAPLAVKDSVVAQAQSKAQAVLPLSSSALCTTGAINEQESVLASTPRYPPSSRCIRHSPGAKKENDPRMTSASLTLAVRTTHTQQQQGPSQPFLVRDRPLARTHAQNVYKADQSMREQSSARSVEWRGLS